MPVGIMTESIQFIAYLSGYFFAILAHFFIGPTVKQMYDSVDPERPSPLFEWQYFALGSIERVLFISALLANFGAIIGAWLLAKIAVPYLFWTSARKGQDKENGKQIGEEAQIARSSFITSIMGNGLSILYALVSYKMIKWILAEKWLHVAGVPALLILFTFFLRAIADSKQKGR